MTPPTPIRQPQLRSQPPLRERPRIRSEQLFAVGNELIIEHRGEEYRLRLTKNDKLILNK